MHLSMQVLHSLSSSVCFVPQIHPSKGARCLCIVQVLMKRLRIIGSTLRARPRQQKVDIVNNFTDYALSKFASGQFKPQVDISFPLAEASQAHQHMADAKNKGKIILLT